MARISGTLNQDIKVISLVCFPHMMSHVYWLVIPPMFPVLMSVFSLNYTEAGAIITAFATATTIAQTPVGFLVDKMGQTSLKLASSRIVDHELLDYVNSRADQVKTVYLSTGGATLPEIHDAVDRLAHIDSLSLLHCVSQYPTDDHNVNLRAIPTIKAEFPHLRVGYSDHSRGIEACLAAVALGAELLEKHFTYHTRMPGDDHEGALTPETLRQLVTQVSRLEVMLGSDEKGPVPDETKALSQLRGKLLEVDFD